MALQTHRFALREPAALGALLGQDWRLRRVLTDDEFARAAIRPTPPALLRQLQRFGLIKALHGVRPQGGRMRLWLIEDAMKADILLALQCLSGLSLSCCAQALTEREAVAAAAVRAWERHLGVPRDPRLDAILEGDVSRVAESDEALSRFCEACVAAYVDRNRINEAARPAFLL